MARRPAVFLRELERIGDAAEDRLERLLAHALHALEAARFAKRPLHAVQLAE